MRREVDDRESPVCARRLILLRAALGPGLAEQLLVVVAVFHRTRHRPLLPRISDLAVEPEPEVDRGSLSAVHFVSLASIPFMISAALYPMKTPG